MSIGTRLRIWFLRQRIRRARHAAEYSRQALGDAHGALLHHRRTEIKARDELDRLINPPPYVGHVPPRPMPQPGLDLGKVPPPRPWPPAPAGETTHLSERLICDPWRTFELPADRPVTKIRFFAGVTFNQQGYLTAVFGPRRHA